MANRRLRLSSIACLQCETRLLQASANRRFSRLATASSALSSSLARPSAATSSPTQRQTANASRNLHGAGISLGRQAEALKSKTTSASDSIGKNSQNDSSDVESELVVGNVLVGDGLVEEPLLDETVSRDAAEEIWTSLLGDEGEPTEDDIFGYIDELQPTDEVLPQSVYEDLAANLSEGFTTSQLTSYVRKNRKSMMPHTVYPWEKKRRPWVPDTGGQSHYYALYGTNNGAGDDGSSASNRIVAASKTKAVGPGSAMMLQGYITASMTNKDKVIAQLMRECWGVSISEVTESPGKLQVEVREVEFTLLEGGAQSWLRDIETAFSTVTTTTATGSKSSSRSTSKGQTRQNRRIELSADKRTLRVYAPQSVADAMMAEIDRVLKSTITKRFDMADVARPGVVISDAALKAVGALTGSWVRHSTGKVSAVDDVDTRKKAGKTGKSGKNKDTQEVVVSWVTPNAFEPSRNALEDTGDVVYRLLLHTFGPSAVVTAPAAEETAMPTDGGSSLYLDHRPLKRSMGRFVACEDNSTHRAKLGWHDRLGKWARWIEPMMRAHVMEAERYAKLKVAPGVWSLPFDFTLPQGKDGKDDKKWYETVHCSTASVFGRVLHEQSHDTKLPVYGVDGTVPPAEPAARVPDAKRAFSAALPPLLGIKLGGVNGTESGKMAASTTVVLRFLPGTKASADASTSMPSLEVTLNAPKKWKKPALSSLRVISDFSVCDTLFPTQMVDVRTTQKRFFELPAAGIHTNADANPIAPLLDFLEQSALDLGNPNEFIATPLGLHQLGLPRAVLGGKVSQDQEAQDETVYVDYLFAGAEVRRRVVTSFQGWTLGLTNVQTGIGQARWTELSLEAIPAGATASGDAASASASNEELKESFREAVGELVHGDAVQWQLPIGQIVS